MRRLNALRWLVATSALALAASCASAAGGAAPSTSSSSSDPNVLTSAEIASAKAGEGNIYDAIARLRPRFLQTQGRRGKDPSGDILMSMGGGDLSSADALRYIPATTVREVRFLSANDAAQRFGVRANTSPVILVTQK